MNDTPSQQPRPALSLTETDFRRRARVGLLAAPATDTIFDPRTGRARLRSDWDLNPELSADLAAMETPRPAAVLIPIVMRDELTVLLTQRTETLNKHAGQISFPGGRIDGDHETPLAAALREADEEIGLTAEHVEPLGYLDGYRTGTGFHITPVVALVRPNFTLTLHEGEVADAFEVPLSFLMSIENHQQHAREWRGRHRQFWAMPYGERYIWGATAGMLKNLHERLFAQ
ncbi:MAG: CoA pyrophosphatase [Hyphomicrobiaceae bacterium]